MSDVNGQWQLRRRPQGMVSVSDFEYVEEPLPAVGDGQVLVRNVFLAFEPAMRGWLDDVPSYMPPVGIGEVMRASSVGQVVESRHPGFAVGDFVSGMLGWQQYALADGAPGAGGLTKLPAGVPPQWFLGVLGSTGLTAYFGMREVGGAREGDTVLVTGAAGATGSVAAQIARIDGAAKVVGVAGGNRKCEWLREHAGVDATIDYKADDVPRRLRDEFPDGISHFFDNVGGELLDQALLRMANQGRITLCGGISAYNEKELPPGPRNYMQIVIRRLTVRGFILIDYFSRAREAIEQLTGWIKDGKLVATEDIQHGFENTPQTFLRLFDGSNLGKQLIQIAEPE